MSDPISTMYFHNMSCDSLNKILFKPNGLDPDQAPYLVGRDLGPSCLLQIAVGLANQSQNANQ